MNAQIDTTDPWRGLYSVERLSPRCDYGQLIHPDLPTWPDDREEALDKLVRAQGFDFVTVAGDFTDEALENGDELYWEEMRAWNPEAPEGEWRLAWMGDTEDGPYAWFVRPMALRPEVVDFQAGVADWARKCFERPLYRNMTERGDRLLEEVLELLQSKGYDSARVRTLVDYVYARPVGEPVQEVGGVMVTLAAFCSVAGLDMKSAGGAELARIAQPEVMEKIRAKQELKNALHFDTPLPGDAGRAATGKQSLQVGEVQGDELASAARAGLPFIAYAFSQGIEGAEEVGRAIEAALAARQPAGKCWSGWATQKPGHMPKLWGTREIAELNHDLTGDARLIFLSEQPAQAMDLGPGIQAIADERERQLTAEGFSRESDQQYKRGELAKAATAYVQLAAMDLEAGTRDHIAWHGPAAVWPWPPEWWRPVDARRDLVRAGALIAAQIDLIDSAKAVGGG